MLCLLLASALFFGGFNAIAGDYVGEEPEKSEGTYPVKEVEEKKLQDSPCATEEKAAFFIKVKIKNHTSFAVTFSQVSELNDLCGGFIPSDCRWFSKSIQQISCWLTGSARTLSVGDEAEVELDPKLMLSFYVNDLSRTVKNAQAGVTAVTAIGALCAAPSVTTCAVSGYKAKSALGEMTRPGERISCNFASGTTIILLDPSLGADQKKVDAAGSDNSQLESAPCAVVIKIIPLEIN